MRNTEQDTGLRLFFTKYTLTSGLLAIGQGLIGRKRSTMHTADIEKVKVEYGIIERLLGIGKVQVGSAASSSLEITFGGVSQPQKAVEMIEESRGKHV